MAKVWVPRPRRAAAVVALVAAVVHVGALRNGFAYDDEAVVTADPALQSVRTLVPRLLEPYWPDAFGASVGSWRPLTTFTFGAVWIASDGRPGAFHALALILHAGASALTVILLAELMPLGAALAGGLLFAVHPVHVEAVANVVGLAEPLSAVFALAALVWWARLGEVAGPASLVGIALLYAFAVLAKEGAVVLPGLLFLVDAARRQMRLSELGGYLRQRGPAFLALATVLAATLAARSWVLGSVASPTHPPGAEVLREIPRIWTLASVWPHYVRLLVLPVDLSSDYAPGVINVAFGWTAAAVVGVGVALAAWIGALVSWRQGAPLGPERSSPRVLGFAVVWAGLALLPVSNILFLGPTILAERTLYMASVGACGALGWLAYHGSRERPLGAGAVLGAALVAFSALTVTRVPTWRNSETVFQTLIEDHPESGPAWWGLARRLEQDGRRGEARRAFAVALDLTDSEYRVALDVGAHMMATGHVDQARFFLRRAWRERPDWYSAPGLLAAAELNAGRPAPAEEAARAAVALAPWNPSINHLLAQALSQQDRPAEAAVARRASLDHGFADRWRSWLLLAQDLSASGDTVSALTALDSAGVRTELPEQIEEVRSAQAALSRPIS